jgi:hypothetical protein
MMRVRVQRDHVTQSHAARLALGGLASLVLAGAASAQTVEPPVSRGSSATLRSCINTSFISNWTPYDDHTILLRAGARGFKVTTNRCPGLTSALPQISAVLRGGSTICSPHDVQLYVSSSGVGPIPCFVQSIQPLTAEETKAMENAGRKKH